jgi:hypothetical protein
VEANGTSFVNAEAGLRLLGGERASAPQFPVGRYLMRGLSFGSRRRRASR